jgi:transketolase
MQFQFDVASNSAAIQPSLQPPVAETVPELLRQMLDVQRDQLHQILEVQREHLNHARAHAQDNLARWRNLLARWQHDYPEFADHCKIAYPLMEKSYVQLLATMVKELAEQDDDALDNEFAVQEFLDRYGMKLGQLSHLLSIIGPLSEAAQQNEASKQP